MGFKELSGTMPAPIAEKVYGNLKARIYKTKEELGRAAAELAAERVREILATKERANLLFSTGASQFEFVAALRDVGIDWSRVAGFHLDEYKGMSPDHPASFRLWLRQRIEGPLRP